MHRTVRHKMAVQVPVVEALCELLPCSPSLPDPFRPPGHLLGKMVLPVARRKSNRSDGLHEFVNQTRSHRVAGSSMTAPGVGSVLGHLAGDTRALRGRGRKDCQNNIGDGTLYLPQRPRLVSCVSRVAVVRFGNGWADWQRNAQSGGARRGRIRSSGGLVSMCKMTSRASRRCDPYRVRASFSARPRVSPAAGSRCWQQATSLMLW